MGPGAVTPAIPTSLSVQKLPKRCRTIAPSDEIPTLGNVTDVRRVWRRSCRGQPQLAELGQCCPKFGKYRSSFGRHWPTIQRRFKLPSIAPPFGDAPPRSLLPSVVQDLFASRSVA